MGKGHSLHLRDITEPVLTLRDFVKGSGRGKKPWKNLFNCTQLGLEFSPPVQQREASSPKAALSLALPPLLPDSFWQLGQVSAEDVQTPGGPRWEGHFSKYKYI